MSGIELECAVTGIAELESALNGMTESMRTTVMSAAVKAGAEVIVNEAKVRAPHKTGNLQRRIHTEKVSVTASTVTFNIVSAAPYSKFVEFGTAPHIIRPKTKKALHWMAGEEDVFARIVHHPGTKPMPFLKPAIEAKFFDACREIGKVLATAVFKVAARRGR